MTHENNKMTRHTETKKLWINYVILLLLLYFNASFVQSVLDDKSLMFIPLL